MKNLFKTTVAAFALFATTAAFALEQNAVNLNSFYSLITDSAPQTVSIIGSDITGRSQFVQVAFTSDSGIVDSLVITPDPLLNFVTNGGGVYFSNNVPVDSDVTFTFSYPGYSARDPRFPVAIYGGYAKKMAQYDKVFVSAKESFGKFDVKAFSAKPKVWGEVVIGTKANGKDKIKKLAMAVQGKISRGDSVDSVSAIVKGTTPIYSKKLLTKEVYGKGLPLVFVETDTGITADSFKKAFDPAVIGQKNLTVTVKAASNLPKGATQDSKRAAKNIEVFQYLLTTPTVNTDSLVKVNIDSQAKITTNADSFRMPSITEGETFTLQFKDLGGKIIVRDDKIKLSTKLKVWVESRQISKNKKETIKKVAAKLDFKTIKAANLTEGTVSLEGNIKKLPRNFLSASAGNVTSLVIETPTGIDAVPVVVIKK